MKYRNAQQFRVLYDLSGRRQEEIEQYQGFLESAHQYGWEVLAVSEQIETQIRNLSERGILDAVVANFVSETWLSTLPDEVHYIHMGLNPLGRKSSCVVWNLERIGQELSEHLQEMGYGEVWVFHPQDQPLLQKGLKASVQYRTQESLREACCGKEGVCVVSPTDYGARLAISVLRSAGRDVPNQMGVAAVGGRSLDAVLSDISITSVQVPYREKGTALADVLYHEMSTGHQQQVRMPLLRIRQGYSTQLQGRAASVLGRVEALLVSTMSNPPPVEEWASRCGMSRRGFERAFATETGCTPYEFLLRLREQEAKRLLEQTTLPVARIGEAIGIPDPPRFSAFFKKRTGRSPSKWKEQAMGQPHLNR